MSFAERPDLAAPEARILWHADLDPGTLGVAVSPAGLCDADSVRLADLAKWLTVVTDFGGREHCVLSDGWHHIRFDIETGRIRGEEAVLFHYRLAGIASADRKVLALRRLLHLCRHGRFARTLFPVDPRIARELRALRVHDALCEGASHGEIARVLFGPEMVAAARARGSDSLRSRVRRLAAHARAMAAGGYRCLMTRREAMLRDDGETRSGGHD